MGASGAIFPTTTSRGRWISRISVKVCPGTYFEHVFISKRLRVVGDLQNPSSTVIDGSTSPPADDHVAIHDTSGVELAGFRVINANSNDAYIGLQRASDNKIHHNLIELNELACGPPPSICFEPVGIFLYDNSDRNDVYRNTVIGDNNVGFPPGPSERGIMLFCETNPCDENRIRNNSITNVFNGIQVTDGQGNVIDHNESFGNGRGFRQFESNFPTGASRVRQNRFHSNIEQFSLGGDGINLSDTSGNTIHHNENNSNDRDGVHLGGNASGNLLNENVADDNGRDGIRAESGATGNTIKNNKMGSVPNVEHDVHDDSTGAGTAGTANTWQNNMCNTSSPLGLCEHPL
jgi:parallel beta-helix repeat protein